MADNNSNNGSSSNTNQSGVERCLICLNSMTNRAMTDTCLHPFCLECLRQWSQTHNICPLCRHVYRNILYTVNSENQVEGIPVQPHNAGALPHLQAIEPLQQMIVDLNNLRVYNAFQEQHLVNLYQQLNYVDPNSLEYIDLLQRIQTTEERIENNHQLIAIHNHNLRQELLRRHGQNPPNGAVVAPNIAQNMENGIQQNVNPDQNQLQQQNNNIQQNVNDNQNVPQVVNVGQNAAQDGNEEQNVQQKVNTEENGPNADPQKKDNSADNGSNSGNNSGTNN